MKSSASNPKAGTTSSPERALHLDLLDAASVVGCVLRGQSLASVLPALAAQQNWSAQRRATAQALSFQTLRALGRARALLRALQPRRIKPAQLEELLLVALALLSLPEPRPYADHTLVFEAVRACASQSRIRHARGLVNALLRRLQAQREALLLQVMQEPEARYNHPQWWIDACARAWPKDWQAMLDLAGLPPPMSLRVNRRWGTRASYLDRLHQAGVAADAPAQPGLEQALLLQRALPVHELPLFDEGAVSVQDISAQRAAGLLDVQPGMRVLDACAAPGGKTAHLLELSDCRLLALERDAERAARIGPGLARLRLPAAQVLVADAAQPGQWWDGEAFDRIRLDAPCSASGISRRHPDIRWLRRPDDVAALAAQQRTLLRALWPLLRPGGRLLYATCSIFPAEGSERVQEFLSEHDDAVALPAPGQILPGTSPARDGFFYALFAKLAKAPA